jgi:hypothetical protein
MKTAVDLCCLEVMRPHHLHHDYPDFHITSYRRLNRIWSASRGIADELQADQG